MYGGPNDAGGQVLDPLGIGAGPSNQFSPLNAAIGDVIDPVGIGAGPSDMYGTAPNRGGPGSGADGYGAGPGYYGQTPQQGDGTIPPGMFENTPSEYLPGDGYYGPRPNSGGYQDLTTGEDDKGPLAHKTATDLDVYESHTQRAKRERVAAQELADEWKERYGLSEDQAAREQEYIEEMQKVYNKQRIMMVLAALSGDQNIANMAGVMAAQSLDMLERKYGNANNARMSEMNRNIMFNSKGEYDPPESQEELYKALYTMGATQKEIEAIAGQYEFKQEESSNWFHPEYDPISATQSEIDAFNDPRWVAAGPASISDYYKHKGEGERTYGGVDMQKYNLWMDKKAQYANGEISKQELADFEKVMGFDNPQTVKINQQFAMFKDSFHNNLAGWTLNDANGDAIRQPDGDDIWEAFLRWKKGKFKEDDGGEKKGDPGSQDNPIKVSSEDQYKEVKSGQWFIDSSGELKQKA